MFSFEPSSSSSEWGLNVTMWELWGPVMFANVKENKWFAVQVVRLVPEGAHIHRLSPVVVCEKWRSKYLKGEINVERARPRQGQRTKVHKMSHRLWWFIEVCLDFHVITCIQWAKCKLLVCTCINKYIVKPIPQQLYPCLLSIDWCLCLDCGWRYSQLLSVQKPSGLLWCYNPFLRLPKNLYSSLPAGSNGCQTESTHQDRTVCHAATQKWKSQR
jgi:hypothetical protein